MITAQLRDLGRVVGGSTPSTNDPSFWDGEVVWITPVDLGKLTTRVITTSQRRITPVAREATKLELIPPGSVVMSSRAPIGHLGIAGVQLCTNQGCKSFVPGPEVEGEFLYFLLRHRMADIRLMGAGATFAEVSKTDIEGFVVTIPPVLIQRRIAAQVSDQLAAVDNARRVAADRESVVRSLRTRAYRHAFADHVPFGAHLSTVDPPAGWTWQLLTDLARLETGHTPSRSRQDWWGGDIPWIALPDIRRVDGRLALETLETTNPEGIAHSAARVLPTDTVVMSRTASVGFVTRMGRSMATSQDFVNWVCGPELDPEFLMHLLIRSRSQIRSLASGAIHKTVYVPTVKTFRVCAPSIAEQRRISARLRERLASIDAMESASRAEREAIYALPAALLRRAFEDRAA